MEECGTKENYSGCPRACEQAESERVGENVLLIVTRNALGQPPSLQSVLQTSFHVPKRHPVKALTAGLHCSRRDLAHKLSKVRS